MRKFLKLLCVLALFISYKLTAVAQTDPSQGYDKLSQLVKGEQVSKIVIIHLRNDVETITRINSRDLRRISESEVSFTKPDRGRLLDMLLDAAGELRNGKTSDEHEVRWGILLFDRLGNERAALFLDFTGNYVQIDDARLQVQGKTMKWIQATLCHSLDIECRPGVSRSSTRLRRSQ
jgi:hypothetical protein